MPKGSPVWLLSGVEVVEGLVEQLRTDGITLVFSRGEESAAAVARHHGTLATRRTGPLLSERRARGPRLHRRDIKTREAPPEA